MPDAERTAQPQRRRSLTQTTARGYAFMLLQTVGTQIVNFVGFIVLGWLLIEDDFGLYALTVTISTAAGLIQRIGLRTILIRRFAHYRTWANPAFWLSGGLGLGSAVVVLAIAPLSPFIFDTAGVAKLLLIVAISMPFNAMCLVPEAQLQAQMRFRVVAMVRFGMTLGMMGMTILFATLGFGAYSFVLPLPLVQITRLVALLSVTRPPLRRRPQWRRWRYMVGDASLLTTSNVSNWLTTQCAVVALGIFHADAVVGVYYYAFGLSQRAVVMLTRNLRDVLFPALSRIQGSPERQVAAFLRASRLVAILGVPACLLQAALAAPAFAAILPPGKMAGAVPVLQILSIGTGFRLVSMPALALIRAQGRYATLLKWSIVEGVAFVSFVVTGATLGAATSVALAVALYMVFFGPLVMWLGIAPAGEGPRAVARVFILPYTAAALAVGVAWWLGQLLPMTPVRVWIQLFGIPLVTFAIYTPMIRLFAKDDWQDILDRIRSVVGRDRSPALNPPDASGL